MASTSITILYVEEDDVDAEFLSRAFKQNSVIQLLTRVATAPIALATLRDKAGSTRFPRPYIIVLELLLSGMTGLEFLQELRQDDELKRSVVFILTSSDSAHYKFDAYAYGIAAYLLKEDIAQDFSPFANLLKLYEMMELPR